MVSQPCEFCGAPVVWTDAQIHLDAVLQLLRSGLGVMCDACDEKQIAAYIAQMERDEAEADNG